MINIIEINKTDIYFIGDIHGQFKPISNWIKQHDLHDCALIFCGDFGLGFDGLQKTHQDLLRANKTCETNNVDCYMIRGNHDDPDYYNTTLYNLDLSRFKALSDYTVIKSPQHNILCLGGAISTDRAYRIASYDSEVNQVWLKKRCSYEEAKKKVKCYWWKNEPFNHNELVLQEIIDSNIPIDTICSHAAPTQCYPLTNNRTLYWEQHDNLLKNDLSKEREELNHTLNYLIKHNQPIKQWFYGHYHEHNVTIMDNIRYILLDMGRNGRTSDEPGGFFDMMPIDAPAELDA